MDDAELLVADAAAWRIWLIDGHRTSSGIWLVLAKKGTTEPTSLTYDQALDEALCVGWIDGQLGRRDGTTFRRRFSPRKATSSWSQRNTTHVERLIAEGRMQPAGQEQMDAAVADGRWQAAYAGQAGMVVPDDLAQALDANPKARAMFDILTSANRYAVLYRVGEAKRADTRARRIATFVDQLARGKTPHPQARMLD